MKITIFYSWQSKNDDNYNKTFLNDCIMNAINLIEQENFIPDLKLDLQLSTENIPGSPEIAKEISNRVRNCDIFIGDFTIINSSNRLIRFINTLFNRNKYKQSNNNVVEECAIAKEHIGLKRIIKIQNSVYGNPYKDINLAHFDSRHERFPIQYSLSSKNRIKEIKEEVVKKLVKEIKLCINETIDAQDNKYAPFKRWNLWKSESYFSQPFKINEHINNISVQIKDAISNYNKSIRILGLSGLGKTRILLELFSIDTSIESKLLSYRVLYYDFSEERTLDLVAYVSNLQKNDEDKILILDNCDIEVHKRILKYINKSNNRLFLITVDSNPEEIVQSINNQIDYIKVNKDDMESIVDEIIKEQIFERNERVIDSIKKFSNNNPLMATLICNNWVNGKDELGMLDDKSLLLKLLGEEAKKEDTRTILRASSLFSNFGFEKDLSEQLEFIATNEDITPVSNSSDSIIIHKFRDVCNHYLARGIFEKRGRKIQMRPIPLALYLSSEWLSTCDSKKILRIIDSISSIESNEHRNALVESLANQMRYFGSEQKAIDIVDRLTTQNGAFHNAEVLNTEVGSRLFRSFVEVNPRSTSLALWNIFGKMKKEELLLINEGRRNIIWALNKLCFNESSFELSTKVLFMFALAENEHWANNSVGELRALFKIFLSGTQANLDDRFKIIEWGYNKNDSEYKELALKCMDSALSSSHFSRVLGAEQQGLETLIEYEPKYEEIIAYWKSIINLIKEPIQNNNYLNEKRLKIVIESVISFIKYDQSQYIFDILENQFDKQKWNHIEGLNALVNVKKYNYNILNDYTLNTINKFVEKLSKDNFKFKFTHGLKLFEHKKVNEEFSSSFTSYEESTLFYKNLGKEFIEENISWDDNLPTILSSDPLYTNSFGLEVSNLIKNDNPKIKLFINKSLVVLNSLNREERNYSIMEGFACNLTSTDKEYLYNNTIKYQNLEDLYIYLITCDKEGFKYFEKLINLINTKPEHIITLCRFPYSNAFINCKPEQLIIFFKELLRINVFFVSFISEILFSILRNNVNYTIQIKNYTKEFIMEYGEYFNLSDYKISMFMIEVLNSENSSKIAQKYNNIIIKSVTLENVFSVKHTAQQIYSILLSEYFDDIWPELSNSLIGINENYAKFYAFKNILGAKIGGLRSSSIGLLFENNNIDKIFEWAEENKEIAPARLAELIPIYDGQNDIYNKLNPIAERLLSLYGESEKVISGFSSNMGSFVWSGSVIPLLEGKMEIFSTLSRHKSDNLRNWAINKLNLTKKEIQFEKDRDEEIYL
ncbi:hypothetical protein [Myroides sp. ZB35]|uniref:hypothetical protein n=1 Tax=Myroides sp. ZB35 TaxID=1458492 RepID=UPI0008F4B901|nr:hypothetical protein [Myroides sp. ZB35]APA92857.1 hypothetical protein BK054_11655 [Myroides sp. ZB35]